MGANEDDHDSTPFLPRTIRAAEIIDTDSSISTQEESLDSVKDIVGTEARCGMFHMLPPRATMNAGSRGFPGGGGVVGTGGKTLPSLPENGSGRHQKSRDRARAVAAVPYPTMRSLRLT